jgi:hypothetical protein
MEEPILKQMWRAWRMKNKRPNADQAALTMIQSMPSDLVLQLDQKADDEPLVKRMITSYVETRKYDLDRRVLDAATRFFRAHTAASRAVIEAARARHELQRLNTTMKREDKLADVTHVTRLLEQQAVQAELRGKVDEQRTARLRQKHERDELKKKHAAAAARPSDEDFEECARELDEHDDVLKGFTRKSKEIEARTDISEEAKQAKIEWLREVAAEVLERRKQKKSPSS